MEENQVHIPDGWVEDSLGNILNYEQPYKYTVDSTDYNDKSGIPVLTAGKSFILGYTTEQHNIYQNTPVIIFDDFTTDSKFVDFPFKVKSSAMKFLKPKNPGEFDIKIIFGHLQNLKIRETGGDHKRRWISEFSKLKVVLPPFTEQTTIARILSKVDEAIAQTEQLIAKYTRIKTGLMQDLLTKGIDEQGNIRSEETHEFKDSPLGRIPKEWEVVDITKFTKNHDSAIKPGPFGSSVKKEFYTELGYKIYGQEQVIANDPFTGDYFIDEKRYKSLYGFRVASGDVLLSCVGTIGSVLIIPDDFEEGIINPRLIKFSLDLKKTNIHFFAEYLKHSSINSQLINLATGGTMPVLNKKIVLSLQFIYPLIDEQNRISEKWQFLSNHIKNEEIKLFKLQSLKTGLMQDLLSGKVRVNCLNQ
jgi:type I restriction enzyme S subunit